MTPQRQTQLESLKTPQQMLPPEFPLTISPTQVFHMVNPQVQKLITFHKIRLMTISKTFLQECLREQSFLESLGLNLQTWNEFCMKQFRQHCLNYPAIASAWASSSTIARNEEMFVRQIEASLMNYYTQINMMQNLHLRLLQEAQITNSPTQPPCDK